MFNLNLLPPNNLNSLVGIEQPFFFLFPNEQKKLTPNRIESTSTRLHSAVDAKKMRAGDEKREKLWKINFEGKRDCFEFFILISSPSQIPQEITVQSFVIIISPTKIPTEQSIDFINYSIAASMRVAAVEQQQQQHNRLKHLKYTFQLNKTMPPNSSEVWTKATVETEMTRKLLKYQ